MVGDAIDKQTRGLTAIAIADQITSYRLESTTWAVTAWRSFLRGFADSGTSNRERATGRGMLFLVLALLGMLALPVIVPVELFRTWKIRRHNRAMLQRLKDPTLWQELAVAARLLAVDWSSWNQGNLALTGSAIVILDGENAREHPPRIVWLTATRKGRLPGNIDAHAFASVHPELAWARCRWEWEASDPFEAVERT
ncbi:MAG: hypothetical protein HOV80_17535 [Polyangiaceae bacterium]|nr:hypothetical protein [Polyangiaceae bacterium]